MNNFTAFRRSKILLSVLAGVGAMAGVAVAQQVCPVLPIPVFPVAPGMGSLVGVPVPLPQQLDTVIKNRPAAIALGKAFFWDKQAGSDGQACASCHFHAGADNRSKNQLTPGMRAVPPDTVFHPTRTGAGGPNYQLKAGDFPFHVLADPLDRNSTVLFHTNDATSSQGTFGGDFLQFVGQGNESCALDTSNIFQVGGKLTRKVPARNTPTTINSIFQFRSFWDGRANNHFNGVNPFGRRDPNARILVRQTDGSVLPEVLDLENAALASQAVGPLLNDTEVSCSKRTFELVARKLFTLIPTPLFQQKVERDDSVLGPYANLTGTGLKAGVTYPSMIQAAFHDKYWLAPGFVSADGYTLMEENFSMFWGLAIMMYESTLVSDNTPFDGFVGVVIPGRPITSNPLAPQLFELTNTIVQPNFGALSQQQVNGMLLFAGKGKCLACHKGPDFTGAGINLQFTQTVNQESVIERMIMGDNGVATYDNGFYNIGVTPTSNDLGVGGSDPFGNPLSFARQFKQMIAGQTVPDPFLVNPCMFEAQPCVPADSPLQRDAVDGSFKTPGLRNVELTGPYMHNGSMATLEQVVEFYNRGGNHRGPLNHSSSTSGFDHSPQWGNNPSNLDPDIQPLGLSAQEQADLVVFLKSLTDERVRCEQAPFDHPSLNNFNGHKAVDSNNDGKLDDQMSLLPSVGAGGRLAKDLACLQPFNTSTTPAVLGFTLRNATTEALIGPLTNGALVNPAACGNCQFNIVALVSGSASNVRISLNGATVRANNEGAAPYTLPGDGGVGNYNGMILNQGVHTLTATPYTSSGTVAGTPMTITFTVGDTLPQPAAPVITSTPGLTATVGMPYSYQAVATDVNGGPLAYSLDAPIPTGMTINPTTGLISWIPAAGQVGANAVTLRVTDPTALFATQPFTVTVAAAPTSTGPMIIGFILRNATTDTMFGSGTLTNGTSVSRSACGGCTFNMEALIVGTAGTAFNNIRLVLTGPAGFIAHANNESSFPYTKPGDGGVGRYNGVALAVNGTYSLTATPRTSTGATIGTPLTVTFTVMP